MHKVRLSECRACEPDCPETTCLEVQKLRVSREFEWAVVIAVCKLIPDPSAYLLEPLLTVPSLECIACAG